MAFGEGVIPTCVKDVHPHQSAKDLTQNLDPIWKPITTSRRFQTAPKSLAALDVETLYAECLCIPGGTLLSTSDQNRIIETVLATAP